MSNKTDRDDRLIKLAQREWLEDGFNIFARSDGVYEIAKLGDPAAWKEDYGVEPKLEFETDEEAVEHVIRLALEGSAAHLLAVWMEGHAWDDLEAEGVPFHMPDSLRTALADRYKYAPQ